MDQQPASNDDRKLAERLRGAFGPTAADLFVEASDAMARGSTATTLVTAHMMREIEGSIRSVLEPSVAPAEPAPEPNEAQRESHRQQVERIAASAGLPPDDPFLDLWRSLVGQLHGVAHRSGQHGARPVDDSFIDLWRRFRLFADLAVAVAEQNIARHLDELDRLLASEPTRETVKTLVESMPHGYQAQSYLFERLPVNWLMHLRKRGYFRAPYEPIRVDNGLRFVSWPPAGYLLKAAEVRSDEVGSILGEVNLNANWAATHELCEVALALPPATGVPFVRKLTNQIRTTDWLPLFDGARVGRLAGHVAAADADVALDFLSALLAVFPDPAHNDVPDESDYRPLPRPRPRVPQDYDYEEILKAAAPVMSTSVGLPWIELLMQLVSEVIELSYWDPPEQPNDHSYIWHPRLDSDSEELRERDARGHLVTALRDSVVAYIDSDEQRLKSVVQRLWSEGRSIFRRIALHLLEEFGPDAASVADTVVLIDRTALDETELRNEAGRALRTLWPGLSSETRERVFSSIEAGRDRDEEDLERRQWWQYKWLLTLRDHLDDRRREILQALSEGRSEPDDPDRNYATWTTSWGPESPYTASEIEALSIDEIRQMLETWEPNDRTFGVNYEGLGRVLRTAVSHRPPEYARAYKKWFGLRHTYVRNVVEGLQDALRAEKPLPWKPVLELCEHVLAQPWVTAPRPQPFGDDPDWSWSRKAVASLVETGLRAKRSIPGRHRIQVWGIIARLLEDADPNPKTEAGERDGGMDAFARSINSVRGVALHAACYYGTWLHRRRLASARDFSAAPELRMAIERRLDAAVDGSACTRSVLAHHFRHLRWLDAGWTDAHADDIFRWEPNARELSLDVWHAYTGWGDLVEPVVNRLLPHYFTALGNYAAADDLDRDCRSTLAHLAVMWLTSIPARANVAVQIVSLSDDRVNAAFVDVVADVLSRRKRHDRAGDAARVEEFWSNRLDRIEPNAAQHQEELMELVSLFAYQGVPLETALKLLSGTLDHIQPARGARVHRFDSRKVLHRLVSASTRNAPEAMRCLAKMIRADTDGVLIMLTRDDIRFGVSRAHRARHAGARREAQAVANLLVARGQLDYRQFAS
ncbi:MAG: hypothetical protein HS107_04455 [Thermoflexaceae bacterium]|nr:hypothetical protein [Thermoflexaceae bacterium]